jgi:ELWxxDGT repeat protein
MKNPLVLILTGSILAFLAPAHAVDAITAQPVTDINPLGDSNQDNITFSHDHLYFTAADKHGNRGIYVKKLTKGPLDAADPVLNRKPTLIRNLTKKGVTKGADNFVRAFATNVSDKMFFHVQGEGLYTTNGSALGTILLSRFDSLHSTEGFSFDPGVTPYYTGDTKHGVGVMGVIFAGRDKKHGVEPFISNGKPGAANTHLMADINPGVNGSFPYSFCARPSGTLPNEVYFAAFGPTDFYQLYRTTNQNTATTSEILVSRNDSIVNNSATAPYGLVLAGNDIVFGAGDHSTDTGTDVCLFSTSTLQASYLTSSNVSPYGFSSGTGDLAYFAGYDGTHGYEPWIASSGGGYAQNYDDIVPNSGSSNPTNFQHLGDQVYWLASDGTSYHLYRDEDVGDPGRIVTTSNGEITVTEYTGVLDSNGNGEIYFVGDANDGNGPIIWKVDNLFGSEQATPVLTGRGDVVKNPSHLGVAVNLTGATSIARLYFSCSGAGTEFDGKGEELWVYQAQD